MRFQMSARWLRIAALTLVTLVAAGCGTGEGEDSIAGSGADGDAADLRLVFRDDFGGPSASPRGAGVAAFSAPLPLLPGDWVVETGYGQNGWGNDEWQRYTNSMDNVFIADGNLVLRAQCATAPACGKRDDTITSGKVITKNRLNVRYGRIRARIKMPSGLGMWPAFWTLGSDIDKRPWPDAGEIDIVEMHYFYSDNSTTHFSTHWSGPRYAPSTRPVCASGVGSSLDPNEEENCRTANKSFDTPLTDDYHIFELDWNENRIIGKIDGITYFEQGIDPATMEEFLKNHYLILNVAVGGTLGGPFGPSMSAADWADPDQTDMKVDWVEVWEKVPPKSATLIDESGKNLRYNRIINSAEFGGGAFVESKLKSTAVPPLVGSSSLELKYSKSRSKNGSFPASFSGAIFDFNNLDVSSFNKFLFSLDASRFPNFNDIGVEFEDSTGGKVLVRTRNYTPMAVKGNWKTYGIPFRDFAGVDMNDIVRIGFYNPNAAPNDVIEIGYVGANTLAGISFGDPNNKSINLDISNLAGGTLEFDALVTKAGSAPWRIKFESESAAAEVLLSQSEEGVAPQVGKWQHYTFPLDTTLGAVDLTTVKYLTFFTTFASSSGKIRIDNIVFNPGAGNPAAEVVAFAENLADQWTLWDCCSFGVTQINDVTVPDETLLAGTLYVDDIRFIAETCTPNPSVAFNLDAYNPAATTGLLSVDDECAANTLVTAEIMSDNEKIFVGMKLDAAGHGEAIFNLVSPASICPASDEFSIITLAGSLEATYKGATATAFIDPGAAIVDIPGERFYFYATDPNQALAYIPDAPVPNRFEYSAFDSGSSFFGSFADPDFNPVFQVTSGIGYGAEVAQLALTKIPKGFAVGKESLNFKVKGLPNNNIRIDIGIGGGFTQARVIDLTNTDFSSPIAGTNGWFEVSVPITGDGWRLVNPETGSLGAPVTDFSKLGDYDFFAFASGDPAPAIGNPFAFLITDIFLEEAIDIVGSECAAPIDAAPTPTEDPADVISVYSGTYGDYGAVDSWSADFDTAELADVQVAGDDIKRYAGLGFAAIETVVTPIDASGMTHLRIDVWSPDVTELRVKLVDFGGDGFDIGGNVNDTEGQKDSTLAPKQWVSLDIPLSDFAGLSGSREFLSQLILESLSGTGTIFVSNIYFYDEGSSGGPGDGELLTNGDFEASATDKAPWINAGGIVTNNFYQADVSTPDPGQPFLVNLSQIIPITPSETYVLTFRARASVNRSMIAGIGLFGGPGGCCDFRNNSEVVPLTTEWQTFSYTLQAIDDGDGSPFGDSSSRVLFDMNGEAGTVNIDDVSLTVESGGGGGGGGGPGPGGELTTNGGFEDDLTGWLAFTDPNGGTIAPDNVTFSPNNGSTKAARMDSGPGNNPVLKQERFATNSVAPGETLNVSFDLFGSLAGAGGVFNVQLFSETTSGPPSKTETFGGPFFPNPPNDWTAGWVTYNLTTTLGNDVSGGITIQFVAEGGVGNLTAYIDNVSITKQ